MVLQSNNPPEEGSTASEEKVVQEAGHPGWDVSRYSLLHVASFLILQFNERRLHWVTLPSTKQCLIISVPFWSRWLAKCWRLLRMRSISPSGAQRSRSVFSFFVGAEEAAFFIQKNDIDSNSHGNEIVFFSRLFTTSHLTGKV